MQLISPRIYPPNHENIRTKTRPQLRNYILYSLRTVSGFFNVPQSYFKQGLWDGAYGLSSVRYSSNWANRCAVHEVLLRTVANMMTFIYLLHDIFFMALWHSLSRKKQTFCTILIQSIWIFSYCHSLYWYQGCSDCTNEYIKCNLLILSTNAFI